MIKIEDLAFEYFERDEEGYLTDMINAIRGINFDAKKGEIVGIVGKNGSGKSTLAKILNRLLLPIEGTVIIGGRDALDENNELQVRKDVGMVFQNPDDQLIGSIVAEDVAFGAENIGVPQYKLWERVLKAIDQAGLTTYIKDTTKDSSKDKTEKKRKYAYAKDFSDRRINELSGGEKQKVAIAGVLAMEPKCIVLDEATSMLDPKSRWDIIALMKKLKDELGITVIMITHMMEELIVADKIYVMHMGKIVMKGRREAIFSRGEELRDYGLDCPKSVVIKSKLVDEGIINDSSIYTVDGIVNRIKMEYPMAFEKSVPLPELVEDSRKVDPVNAILFDKVSFSYGKKKVLDEVSLTVAKGEYVAIVGSTGSGKSTLLSHIPRLISPSSGSVYVDGMDIGDRSTDIRKLRCKIGYVFQYPEQQLFAKNVYEDVVFGPRNVGISEVEAEKRAYEAISLVGLSEDVYDMPLSKLSGGQRRRVALAGVLAMKPEYLILDEPVAGLDPAGKEEMLAIIDILHREVGITILMVSHDIESVAKYADKVIVMEKGNVVYNGSPANAFYTIWKETGEMHQLPVMMQILIKLREAGLPVECFVTEEEAGIAAIKKALGWHFSKE